MTRYGRLTITRPPTDDTTPAPTPDEAPHADAPASSSSADVDVLDAMDISQGKDPEACRDALYAVRDYLEQHGPASRREIVTVVMPDHRSGTTSPISKPATASVARGGGVSYSRGFARSTTWNIGRIISTIAFRSRRVLFESLTGCSDTPDFDA
jgi:hypothetical protein